MGLLSQDRVLNGSMFGSASSNIKSIQRGTVSFTTTDTWKDVTISPVNTSKTIVRIIYHGSGPSNENCFYVTLTNSTTIRISRYTATNAYDISWTVEEYNNVKSLQTGTLTPTSNDQNVTIASIDPTKSILVISWESKVSQSAIWYFLFLYSIVDSTTLNFKFNTSGTSFIIKWQVLEFI